MIKKQIFYSKSFKDIIDIKKDFLNSNRKLLKQAEVWNKFYSKQPKRVTCKTCEAKLPEKIFRSHSADYTICTKCGHLNGLNLDTKTFNKHLYKDSKGIKFSKFYINNFKNRVKNIYHPKLKFLQKIIGKNLDILELGSGAGYFLKACEEKKVNAIGYDVNLSMVEFGKKMLKKNKIFQFEIDEIYNQVLLCKKETIVILGVIEHLENPNLIFKNFRKSEAKHLFFSVPTMSLSTILEHSFKMFYPRVLGGVHNHLYSEKSLNFIIDRNKLKIIGEWWFGTDIMDLMRAIIIYSNPYNKKNFMINLNKYFIQIMDELQSVLDKKKLCGDVHMVLSK